MAPAMRDLTNAATDARDAQSHENTAQERSQNVSQDTEYPKEYSKDTHLVACQDSHL